MEPDKTHVDPNSEVAQAVQALNELRDVLNDVSLNLKDLQANHDFAAQGTGWMQSAALIDGLFQSLESMRGGNAGKPGAT